MPDLIIILQKWWKRMALLTIAAMLVTLVVLLLMPKKYLSTATALPANSLGSDKASVFNTGIQQLYSSLGSPGELDRFMGTGRLDTVYIAVAKEHNLQQHYSVQKNSHALYNAAKRLKQNTRIDRTEYGELQVDVWDEDKDKAAALANGIMQQLQQMHQQLQSQSNRRVLQQLKQIFAGLQGDSSTMVMNMDVNNEQRTQYEKLVAQYSLMVQTNPPALLVVEAARPGIKPDKPDVWPALVLTFFAALLFSFLMALFLEMRTVKNV